MSKLDRAYYDILDARIDFDEAAIKKAYKKAALAAHPDKGGSDEMMVMVNEAFQVLSDPTKRAEYDRDVKKYKTNDGKGMKTAKQFQKAAKSNE